MEDAQHPVVLIDIDGMKRELFYNLLADGALPGFMRLFGRGARVRYGVTVYPSETLPAQTSLFTGLYPGRHGIVGNGWLERGAASPRLVDFSRADTAAMVFGYRLYGLPTLLLPHSGAGGLINDAMFPGARTLYERLAERNLRSVVVFSHISRGAGRWVRPSRAAVVYFALSTRARLDYTRMDRITWSTARRLLIRDGLPDMLTLYFCGLDSWGHHTAGQGQETYITRVLDPIMADMARLFEERVGPWRTRFALCSDHGHSWLGDRHRVSHTTLMSALAAAGRRPFTHAPLSADADCYINVIGGSVQLHVRAARGGWNAPPDLESDLLPLARALEKVRHPHAPAEPCFALVLVRPAPGAAYHVLTSSGLTDAEDFFWEKLDRFPNAFTNIRGLNCARSGDIVLFANFERGFYFSDETVPRSHGSLSPDDMGIPIMFAGPGIRRGVIERASIVDIAPTILSLFGIDPVDMDGSPIHVLDA